MSYADQEIGQGLSIYSGYRSPEHQSALFDRAVKKYGSASAARKWVAPPGRSNHNHGIAADLMWNGKRLDKAPARVKEWVHENAAMFGLTFRMHWEPWHVELDADGKPMASVGGPDAFGVTRRRVGSDILEGNRGNVIDDIGPDKIDERLPAEKGDFLGDYAPGFGYTVEQHGQDRVSDFSRTASETRVMEFINGIEDPITRAEYAKEYADMMKSRETALANHEKQVRREAEQLVLQGKYAEVTEEQWQTAGVQFRNQMDAYVERKDAASNLAAWHEVRKLAVDDPEAFKKFDLTPLIGHLKREDYKGLVELQSDIIGGKDEKRTKIAQMKNVYEPRLRAVGIMDTPSEMSSEDHERKAAFERELLNRVEAFEADKKRPATELEIADIVDTMLVPFVLDKGTFVNTKGFYFEAPLRGVPGETKPDLSLDDVPPSRIPVIARELRTSLGRTPTSDEVVDAYGRWLIQRKPGEDF
jgi:hypothetical protein